ncbi:MAG: hypothetical protein WD356_10800 [Pseudomonadales bacterium]
MLIKPEFFPNIVDLVPHTGEMVMLHRVVSWHGREVVVAVDLTRPNVMADKNGRIPGYVALEFMAQGIAVAGGLERRAQGKGPMIGLVLGARKFQVLVSHFPTEGEMHVHVRETFAQNPVAVCDASITLGNECLARGEIKVTQPDSEEIIRKLLRER